MKRTTNKTAARKAAPKRPPARKAAPRPPAARQKAAQQPAARRPGRTVDPQRVLVRDLMQTDVLVLGVGDPIKEAAERFEELHISGAPVVDAGGHLVGVLTLSDIARSEHVSDESGVTTRFEGRAGETLEGMVDAAGEDEELMPAEDYDTQVLGGLRVGDWMSPGVIQVELEATLATVCRRMVDEAIHRVFVTDGTRLVGVLSSEDVVRLLAEPAPRRARAAAR